MARISVVAHEIRAQSHENRAFSRGKLSKNRCLSHLVATTFYYINTYISLSPSMLLISINISCVTVTVVTVIFKAYIIYVASFLKPINRLIINYIYNKNE